MSAYLAPRRLRTAFASVLAAAVAACEGSPSEKETWTATANEPAVSMPLLSCTSLPPARNAQLFVNMDDRYTSHERTGPGTEDPFATDDEAVRAAIDWIVVNFGPLPEHTALVPTSIDHSARGLPEPQDASDRGHTVVLRQTYRGIATDRGAVIYIQGRTGVSGSVHICRFAPIAGSERPTIARSEVLEIVRKLIGEAGQVEAANGAASPEPKPYLIYVYSPRSRDGREVLSLNWAFGQDTSGLVDAHSGRFWRND